MISLPFAFFVVLCAFHVNSQNADKYTNRFDGIDIDKVLNSDRLLDNYHKCLMDRGPCTPAGSELKKYLPDALKSECAKCTEDQRKKSTKVTNFLLTKKPKMYKELEEKYDPTGNYRARDAARKAKLAEKS